jgi:hypothetical protein
VPVSLPNYVKHPLAGFVTDIVAGNYVSFIYSLEKCKDRVHRNVARKPCAFKAVRNAAPTGDGFHFPCKKMPLTQMTWGIGRAYNTRYVTTRGQTVRLFRLIGKE